MDNLLEFIERHPLLAFVLAATFQVAMAFIVLAGSAYIIKAIFF